MTKESIDELARARQLIDAVDLQAVQERLIKIEGWKIKEVLTACELYRNYLYLKKKYGNQYVLPPSLEIDEVWHAHILHTEDYMYFCNQVFGGFLHHHPHHGKNNEITDKQLKDMFENQTQKLYKENFGQYIYTVRPASLKKKVVGILQRIMSLKNYYINQQMTKSPTAR